MLATHEAAFLPSFSRCCTRLMLIALAPLALIVAPLIPAGEPVEGAVLAPMLALMLARLLAWLPATGSADWEAGGSLGYKAATRN